MLLSAARSLGPVASLHMRTAASIRSMTTEGIKAMRDRETAQEASFFTQEDQRVMAKLLAKAKEQSKTTDQAAARTAATAERNALKEILGKYKVSDADLNRLDAWKSAHY